MIAERFATRISTGFCTAHLSQAASYRQHRPFRQSRRKAGQDCSCLGASSSTASWESFRQDSSLPQLRSGCRSIAESAGPRRQVTRMGNKSGTGPFTPIVIVVRNVMGKKEFNQLRGKAISLHSQVIKSFGGQIGADQRQVQGLIRLAKKNGEKLGFLS